MLTQYPAQPVISIWQYENCLKKFFKYHNTEVMVYLARAYFKCGRLKECKTILLKVQTLPPSPYQTQWDNFRFDTIEQDYHTQPPH